MKKTLYTFIFMMMSTFMFAQTIVDIIVSSPDHTTLETAVIAAELDGTLSDEGSFTVFAPTDAAFDALPMGTVDALLADPTGDLARILLYHVLGAEIFSNGLSNGLTATTLLGQDIAVTIDANGVFINNAKVTVTNLNATNGVVHVIDAVMLPPASTVVDVIVNSPVHTILETAVIDAELASTLSGDGPFTVFAPTDAAFNLLPPGTIGDLLADPTGDLARILLNHVIGGEALAGDLSDGQMVTTLLGQDITINIGSNGVFINNDIKISGFDIRTLNGVVHVIDAVVLPAASTVVDVIVNSPDHTTLEAAVIAAELDGALSGDGPFTVFAPTDAAFDALPMGTVDALLADPTGDLARILLYHVVGGEVLAGDLSDGQMATTLLGQGVDVTIDANGVFINNAQVIVTDIRTLNGVVHVLDAVILPPASTVVDVVVNSPDHTTLESAVIAAELAGALSEDGPFTLFAPTDAAFDALPDGTVDALLADPTGDLAQILLYHTLDGEVLSSQLSDGQTAATKQGQEVTVKIDNGVFINETAQVVAADIRTLNGVVHVINQVLLPDLTSVKDLNEVKAQVMPNPASDYLQIEFPEEMRNQDVQAQIISMNGSIIKSWESIDSQERIDVSALTSGTYIVLVQTKTAYARNLIFIE